MPAKSKRPLRLEIGHVLFIDIVSYSRVRVFTSYSAALKAGQQECGHGKFWVQSEFQRGERWVDFAPDTSPLLG